MPAKRTRQLACGQSQAFTCGLIGCENALARRGDALRDVR